MGMNGTRMVRWVGTNLGSFESALACELARQAKSDRDRSRAICVFSEDTRLRR
jgi:hypothetical protein